MSRTLTLTLAGLFIATAAIMVFAQGSTPDRQPAPVADVQPEPSRVGAAQRNPPTRDAEESPAEAASADTSRPASYAGYEAYDGPIGTEIVRVAEFEASHMARLLDWLIAPKQRDPKLVIAIDQRTNALILRGATPDVALAKKTISLLQLLDDDLRYINYVDGTLKASTTPPDDPQQTRVEAIFVGHAQAETLAEHVTSLLRNSDRRGPVVRHDPRYNAVLAKGTAAEVKEVRDLVERLDVPAEAEAATDATARSEEVAAGENETPAAEADGQGSQTQVVVVPLEQFSPGTLSQLLAWIFKGQDSVSIQPHPRTNAILLRGSTRHLTVIQDAIKALERLETTAVVEPGTMNSDGKKLRVEQVRIGHTSPNDSANEINTVFRAEVARPGVKPQSILIKGFPQQIEQIKEAIALIDVPADPQAPNEAAPDLDQLQADHCHLCHSQKPAPHGTAENFDQFWAEVPKRPKQDAGEDKHPPDLAQLQADLPKQPKPSRVGAAQRNPPARKAEESPAEAASADGSRPASYAGYGMQFVVVPLKSFSPTEMSQLLNWVYGGAMGRYTTVQPHPRANALLLRARAMDLEGIQDTIAALERLESVDVVETGIVADAQSMRVERVAVEHVAPSVIAKNVDMLFENDVVRIDRRPNSVLVKGLPQQVEKIRQVIAQLDIPADDHPPDLDKLQAELPKQPKESKDAEEIIEVFRLERLRPESVLNLLQDPSLYPGDDVPDVTIDERRKNSVVVQGSRKQLDAVRRLLSKIDSPGSVDVAESMDLQPSRGVGGYGGDYSRAGYGAGPARQPKQPQKPVTEIRIFRLQHASAADMAELLGNPALYGEVPTGGYGSGYGGYDSGYGGGGYGGGYSAASGNAPLLRADPRTNSLIVRATAEQLTIIEALLKALDVPVDGKEADETNKEGSSGPEMTTVPAPESGPDAQTKDSDSLIMTVSLRHASADDMASILKGLRPGGDNPYIAVDPRTNSLILRGTREQLQTAQALLTRLDIEGDAPKADPTPLGAPDTSSASDAERSAEFAEQVQQKLLDLQVQRELMLEQYGEDHPKVRMADEAIERTRDAYDEITGASEIETADAASVLIPLMIEEQTLLQKFGPDHPKSKELRHRIELTKRLYGLVDGGSKSDDGDTAGESASQQRVDVEELRRLLQTLLGELSGPNDPAEVTEREIQQLENTYKVRLRRAEEIADDVRGDDIAPKALEPIQKELRGAFEARQKLQAARIGQARRQLDVLAQRLQHREEMKDEIVRQRAEELLKPPKQSSQANPFAPAIAPTDPFGPSSGAFPPVEEPARQPAPDDAVQPGEPI